VTTLLTTTPADANEPWDLLHDGSIVRLERDLADTVTVWIECGAPRAHLAEPGTLFKLRLAGCTLFTYTPYDEPTINDLAAIASSEPDINQGEVEDGVLRVWGGSGVITARYASWVLELDFGNGSGRVLPLEELARAVRAFWDAWRAHWKQP